MTIYGLVGLPNDLKASSSYHHNYPSQRNKEQTTTRHIHIRDKEPGSVNYDMPIVLI